MSALYIRKRPANLYDSESNIVSDVVIVVIPRVMRLDGIVTDTSPVHVVKAQSSKNKG